MNNLENRFHKYVKKGLGNDCWKWVGGINADGYGKFNIGDKCLLAHRVSYEIYKGKFDKELQVLHLCDTPSCVNPEHLKTGTHLENMADMTKKGRHADFTGENCGNSKLKWEDIKKIRLFHSFGSKRQNLAHQFGVNFTTISRILNNKTWKV